MIPLRLPFPPRSLFPNRKNGKHWSSTATAKAVSRNDGMMLAKSWKQTTGFKPDANARYGVYIAFEVARDNKDVDNMHAACKALLDGVAIGLGINDKQFRPITLDVVKAKTDGVLLTIEEWAGK